MILADYHCPDHGHFEQMVESPSPDSIPCPDCSAGSSWVPFPVRGSVKIGEVQRGPNDKPDSPMYLDTRSLGEGEPYADWRARRDKMYEERRHKEGKEL